MSESRWDIPDREPFENVGWEEQQRVWLDEEEEDPPEEAPDKEENHDEEEE